MLKLQVEQEREGNRPTSVSEQSSLWPRRVPGWQPSRERMPPAKLDSGWAGRWNDVLAPRCVVLLYLFVLYVYSVVGKRWRSVVSSS